MKTISERDRKTNQRTEHIEEVLRARFPNVKAYFRPSNSVIRVRVVDAAFAGKTTAERENMVFPLLDKMPRDILDDLTFLLLVTPEEQKGAKALLDAEFEDPSRSSL